ncbi:MAG: IPT/TIG domain-containing protein [Bryobacteraceae bacterium]|jgi:uncharacterized protein (TIGR03437 family)
MAFRCLLATFVVFAGAILHAQGIISTIAGNGNIGDTGDGGPATSATLGSANGIVVDNAGNIYFADSIFSVVRKVNAKGIISTFAGGNPVSLGDGGLATNARLGFQGPHAGLAVDSAGNLYIADYFDGRIRKVDTSGMIRTVAGNSASPGLGSFSGDGGPAINAGLNSPTGVALDSAGNIYIADYGNQRVRKVDTTGKITTIAGIGAVTGSDSGDGGLATQAELGNVYDVAVDGKGNVYIADSEHVREVNSSGIISTAAKGFFGTCILTPTPAASADVAANGFALDSAGNLYIADKSADCVQELETNGMVSTVAGGGASQGDGGPATDALLISPAAVALDSGGNLYIATSSSIRKVTASTTQPSAEPIISANGVLNGASFGLGISPNSWVTIQGTNFTNVTDSWTVTGGVLPTKLDGVSVSIGGLPAYVNYISPTQINVLTPADLTDQFPMVIVTNTVGSSVAQLAVSEPENPAFFMWPGNQPVATHEDFTWAVKNGTFPGVTTVPAKPGETIILWGTGFGPTNPVPPAGMVVPSDKTYSITAAPTVEVNLVPATVYGAALAPGFAGLYQMAFQVPAALADGDYQVFATVGVPSANVPTLTVQQ